MLAYRTQKPPNTMSATMITFHWSNESSIKPLNISQDFNLANTIRISSKPNAKSDLYCKTHIYLNQTCWYGRCYKGNWNLPSGHSEDLVEVLDLRDDHQSGNG